MLHTCQDWSVQLPVVDFGFTIFRLKLIYKFKFPTFLITLKFFRGKWKVVWKIYQRKKYIGAGIIVKSMHRKTKGGTDKISLKDSTSYDESMGVDM